MSDKKCCVPGCFDSGGTQKPLHIFPNPAKERQRFNLWVISIGGDILGLENERIYKYRRVCHAHFEDKYFCTGNRISNIAVPTLNLPGPLSLPKFCSETKPLRNIQIVENADQLTTKEHVPMLYMASSVPFRVDNTNKENLEPVPLVPSTSTSSVLLRVDNSNKENLEPVPMVPSSSTSSVLLRVDNSNKENLEPVPMVPSSSTSSVLLRVDNSNKENLEPVPMVPSSSTSSVLLRVDNSNKENLEPVPMVPSSSTNSVLLRVDNSNKENLDPEPTVSSTIKSMALQIDDSKKVNLGTSKGKIVKKTVQVNCTERKLYEKLIQARIKLSKCRSKIKQQALSLKAAKKITSNPTFLATLENFSSAAKIITLMQFRELKKRNKGRRFTLEEKILALTIFKQSPKGYRFLRTFFVLPAPQTLAKLITKANIQPGINKQIFQQLKNITRKMKTKEKLCVVLYDEMFLKANVTYNEGKDKTVGFVTDGHETRPDFADHAQVYMVRGLIKNYKQAVAFNFSAGATKGQQIAKQLREIITELQEAGLIVVATICDQGANNKRAINLLIQETRGIYLRRGEEPKDNIININNSEIIPLFDPPHLIKCIRNNLLTKNLEYTVNGLKKVAKWEHIELLHKENPGYKGVRLIPKLTDSHVIPKKISKMKVKLASQVFSRTVATNMGYLADKGILPKECSETADIIIFFDNLFDSQNGSFNKKNQAHGKPLLGAVTPKSAHHAVWADALKKLKEMKFIDKHTGEKTTEIKTLRNWAWTLKGTEILLKKLEQDYNITSVWMRHLNQDPIENFFGAIRSHGCRDVKPTPQRFESAFTSLLINNISSVHAPVGANCEKDFCQNLQALIVKDCKATTSCDLYYLPDIEIEDIDKKKSDPRIIGALQYVSGYFLKKAKNKVFKGCTTCCANLITKEGAEYIRYREYAGRRWLCSPTEAVITCISAIQDITNCIIREFLEVDNLKELIKTHVIMHCDFNFLDCRVHKDEIINYLTNITARFFIYHYCKDLNRILNGKKDITADDSDKFEIKAKKYFLKCFKRPRKP